jgi:cytochrome o ubiquinol oxidase operon protein cyoD
MSDEAEFGTPAPFGAPHEDVAPGDQHERPLEGVIGYAVGLFLATLLTAISFWVAYSHVIWTPGIPVGLLVLAVAQMGVHLVFFIHITTGADNTNNVLALAFGILIVVLIVGGSLWIMANLNANTMPTAHMMDLQQQR